MPERERDEGLLSLDERIRRDPGAKKSLEKLLADPRIKESELWRCLHLIETCKLISLWRWRDKSGLDRRQARKLRDRLLRDAKALESFLTSKYKWYLMAENQGFLWLKTLPRQLVKSAAFIDWLLRATDERGPNPDEDFTRKWLADYVQSATGRPHDKEVANLARIALNNPNITAEDQRKFRTRRDKNRTKPD